VPGTTWFVTRRCSERRFFLRPCRVTNEIFLYALALATKRHRVLVHACCVLSNQYDKTDVGRIPGAADRVCWPSRAVASAGEAVDKRSGGQ
jgi:hypothetical protein